MKEVDNEKLAQGVVSALDLFMKFGIKSLTMDDVARKLGMSKKTLYQFVKDKKAQIIFFESNLKLNRTL